MLPSNFMRVVVIAKPGAPHLSVLDKLPKDVQFSISPEASDHAGVIGEAEVIVNSNHNGEALRALWPQAKSVKWVHSLSAGVEGVIFPELAASPVPLTNARGVYKRSLGEFAVLGMLFFAKDVRRLLRQQAAGNWEQFDVDEIRGATCGIVGYGEIGREVAARVKGLGMKVIASRRRVESPSDEYASEIVGSDRIADVMSRSDYVVCCAPLTSETHHMVGAREFQSMKKTGVFINLGRGAVVDEAALVDALHSKRIRGAALDVFEVEPLPKDSPLWKLDNLLLSPHCADHTATWLHESVEFFVENFERYRKGEKLLNYVDKKAGY